MSSHSFHGAGVQAQPNQSLWSGSHWAVIKPMGLWSQLRLQVLFQMHVVVGRIHFLAAVELMMVCPFKASRREISVFYFKRFICSGPSY